MRSGIRVVGPAMLAATLFVGVAGVAHAGGEAGGDITFRLILRGNVTAGDAFTLGIMAIDNKTIISPGVMCGPGVLEPRAPLPCEPGTYEFVLVGRDVIPIGTEFEYTWARSPNEVIYTDTVTVTQNAQVLTVVYEYPGASMPNTAMPAPADGVPFGILAVIGAVLVALAYAPWRPPRPT